MILAGLFVLSEACSDEVKAYLEDIPDPGQYTSLYMGGQRPLDPAMGG